jgi:hypothetical protein
MQHIEKYELAEHELVMQYVPGEFPVPLLPVQRGLQCKSEDCAYLRVAEKRMKHHWLSVHGRQGLASCDWQMVPLQTFFKGNLLRYFTGTPSGKSAEITARFVPQNGTDEWTVCNQNKFQKASLTRTAGTASRPQPLFTSNLHNFAKNSQ